MLCVLSVGEVSVGEFTGLSSPPMTLSKNGDFDKKTYNTRDSLVVTDPTTSLALTSLSRGERTGSRVL